MAIKFRCNYCRQFLGISRSQAGGVVDCPTCGRSIRVPELDGTVQPLSNPELNVEDQHLVKALEELARLADEPVQQYVSLRSSSDSPQNGEIEPSQPQPLLEPIPIEVPLPPTPVAVQPSLNANLANGNENPTIQSDALIAELAALSAANPVPSSHNSSSEIRSTASGRLVALSPLAFVGLILFVFIVGMVSERIVRQIDPARSAAPSSEAPAKFAVVGDQLTGRITYKTKQGDSQPDRGARILVFPEKKTGEVKLSVVGFRPSDSEADQQVANAAVKAMGGGAGTADESGTYRLPLQAGVYRLLIVSHFQAAEDRAKDPALLQLLNEYFSKAEDFPGRLSHQLTTIRFKGTGDVWDHSF